MSEQLVQRVNLYLALGGGWADGSDTISNPPKPVGK